MRHKCNIEIPETPPLIAGPGSKWDPLRVVPIQTKYLNLPLDPNSFYVMDDNYEYEWDDCREQKELSAAEQIACPGYIESNNEIIIDYDPGEPLRREVEDTLDFLRLASYPVYVPGKCKEWSQPDFLWCRLCGCKKDPKDLNEKNLCPKCADVEKLMAECLDETGKVDLSGHVGQREEITLEDLSRMRQYGIYTDEESSDPIPFHPRWPSRTAADEYAGYLVVPFTNPLTGTTIRATEIGAEYQGVDGQWHPLSELDNS